MEGHLEIIASGRGNAPRHVALPIGDSTRSGGASAPGMGEWFVIGPAPHCNLVVHVAGWEDEGLAFQWDWRHASWTVKNLSSVPAMVDAMCLSYGQSLPLLAWHAVIRVGDLYMKFHRVPQRPRFKSQDTSYIPLDATGLIMGRGDRNKVETNAPRLELDAKILSISSNQAEIVRKDGSFHLINHNTNPTGRTIVNGDQGFDEKELHLGDCIEIPNCDYYTFKFDGHGLRHLGFGGTLRGQDLVVDVPGFRILHPINLQLAKGELLGILGGSGQGKSTLMNALCGIVPATDGVVTVDGIPLRSPKDVARVGIGYVPQDDIVHKELRVDDALRYAAKLRLSASSAEIDDLLNSVMEVLRLTEHRYKRISNLSGGQRKRVSIASELLTSPEYLFLDEPTSGLDPQTEKVLMGELAVLAKRKRIGVACTTHVLQNCHVMSSLAFISRGRLIFHGTPLDTVRFFLFSNSGTGRDVNSSVSMTSSRTASSTMGLGDRGKDGAEFSDAYLLANINRIYDIAQDTTKPIEEQNRIAEAWEASYKQELPVEVVGSPPPPLPALQEAPKTSKVGALKSAWILMARQWKILIASKLNYLFLAAQALVIGFLIGWVDENSVLQSFLAVIATLWFGCSNGAQQIVAELAIFRRERLAGLGIHAYLWSKVLFLGAVTVAQAIALYFTMLLSSHFFHSTTAIDYEKEGWDKDWAKVESAGQAATPPEMWEQMLAYKANGVPSKEVREFRKAFFDKDWPALARGDDTHTNSAAAEPATAAPTEAKPFQDDGFTLEDAAGAMAPTPWDQINTTRTVHYSPTGIRLESMEFKILEKMTFFFRLKDNVLGTLAVKRKVTDDKNYNPELEPKISWHLHLVNILGLRFIALAAAAMVGVGVGLAVSSLVNTPTQAVMWVPLILIPQILFGSFVVIAPEMDNSVLRFSRLLPSFNLQRIMDVALVFGRETPRMTNQTKIPAFLGAPPDDEEIVEWSGRQTSYDKISDVNKSWQNLLVIRDRIGMREKVANESNPNEFVNSLEVRDDVMLNKGQGYYQLGPAYTCGGVLLGWFVSCYVISCISLYRRQTGR